VSSLTLTEDGVFVVASLWDSPHFSLVVLEAKTLRVLFKVSSASISERLNFEQHMKDLLVTGKDNNGWSVLYP
jgi:hypothetical protein